MLLGNRGEALRSMGEIGLGEGPHRWTALEVAVRGMEIYEGAAFIRRMSGVPALRRAMVVACGHLGDPAAVPWLMTQMAEGKLARAAGEAFSMITGADLALEDLERASVPDDAVPPIPARDDGIAAPDRDEHLPWPDPEHVHIWWDLNGAQFARTRRHLMGHVGDRAPDHAWEAGSQRQRRSAACQKALLTASTGLLNIDARADVVSRVSVRPSYRRSP